jgi:16S rRNA (uracil1498-N3)-methyltransferase
VAPRRLEPRSAPCRRFFLERSPLEGRPELAPGESEHALRVLRLRAGDAFVGLDGRGRAWPMRVRAVERMRADIECTGEPVLEPRAGEPDADLDWIELALVLPRGGRAEELVDAATQLGVSAIRALVSERAQPASRHAPIARADRLQRAAIEACKQSGRLWLPAFSPARPLSEWLLDARTGDTFVLSPRADIALSTRLDERRAQRATRASGTSALGEKPAPGRDSRSSDIEAAVARWSEASPLRLVIGPEGGFTADEEKLLQESGAIGARLGPHVLRIEIAALAASAIAAERCFRPRRS